MKDFSQGLGSVRRVKTGNREKERTQMNTYIYQSKTKRWGEQRRLALALAKDQSLKVAVAFWSSS